MRTVLLVLFIIGNYTYSATAQLPTNLYGKWQLDSIKATTKPDTSRTELLEKALKTLSYLFKQDSTYNSSFIGLTDFGTWEYNQKINKLILYSSKGEIQPFDIINCSEDELVLNDRNNKTMFFKRGIITAQDSLKRQEIELAKATRKQLSKLWYLKAKENPNYSKEQQELTNTLIKGFTYRFDEDGVIYTKAMSVENETHWEFGENNETLIIKGDNFDIVWNILSIEENQLILTKGDFQDKWIFSTEK